MSHLGDRLSALVDGELDGADRDRAYAHLAGCDRCRAEAAELRALKQKLRSLMRGAPAEAAMTSRLIAMTGPGGPQPPRPGLLRGMSGPRPAGRGTVGPGMPGPRRARRRRRYLVIGAMSLVVGLGTAAFTAGGGGEGAPGPKITPQVELYGVEHAINTGGLPFTGPSDPSDPSGLTGPSVSGQPVPVRSASYATATAP
jgi:anti-sigma factor RsiW